MARTESGPGPLARREDGYEIDNSAGRLDLALIHRWLSTDAYWALGRPLEKIARSIDGSLCFGLYKPDGAQVGFARAVTDHATFAWLCDVYIDRSARSLGLGTWLVGVATAHLAEDGVRLLLATKDAHGVYEKVGFRPLDDPGRWMERPRVAP